MNKSNMWTIIIIVAIIALATILFWGGNGTDETNNMDEEIGNENETETKISLSSGPFFFTPNTLTAKKSQEVEITFANAGTHTFTIDELGVDERLDGSSQTIRFTPTKTGTFIFYCAIPGHLDQGMKGTITVTE